MSGETPYEALRSMIGSWMPDERHRTIALATLVSVGARPCPCRCCSCGNGQHMSGQPNAIERLRQRVDRLGRERRMADQWLHEMRADLAAVDDLYQAAKETVDLRMEDYDRTYRALAAAVRQVDGEEAA